MIRLDAPLMVSWGLVLGFGLVMVASASVAMDLPFLARHGIYLTIGLMGFLVMLCVPLKVWNHTHQIALLGALALCALVLVPGVTEEVKGARRWIDFGSFTLQPAEIAKAAHDCVLGRLLGPPGRGRCGNHPGQRFCRWLTLQPWWRC